MSSSTSEVKVNAIRIVSPELWAQLFDQALSAQKRSHSPYSKCSVGAALLTSSGEIFSGCNVENASFGATTCAERNAITTAVGQRTGLSPLQISALVVVTDASPPWSPCGMCRQVIAEFSSADLEIICASTQLNSADFKSALVRPAPFSQTFLRRPFRELFPSGFSPDQMV